MKPLADHDHPAVQAKARELTHELDGGHASATLLSRAGLAPERPGAA